MDLGISGKWALVCGASRGLGFGCAQALAREGVNLVIAARGREALDAAAAQLREETGVQVLAVAADVTTEQGRAAILAERSDFDIVVNNAGGPPAGDFRDWGRDDWMAAIDANMLSAIELMKATIDGMLERGFGRIVNITSSSVKEPIDVLGLSGGARSGLTGFMAGVARNPEIARGGVTINNLLPGRFDTARIQSLAETIAASSGSSVEQVRAVQEGAIPAGRYGTPAEFGALCAFVCSQHAGYLTGQNLLLDGGAYPGIF